MDVILDVAGSNLRPRYADDGGRLGISATPSLKFDCSKAERRLGWRPMISLREGIKRVIEWREQTLRCNEN
jgi:UDP-glucose 4-epimerase